MGCVFIQTNEMMSKGHEECIRTSTTVFAISTKFKHLNFDIKGGIIHPIFPISF
jgi:hypothetical protein